jgi:hypothetical protein
MPVSMLRGRGSRLFIFACFCFLLPSPAQARLISYAGGWMFMTDNDQFANRASMVYSPTATTGIGPFIDHYRDTSSNLAGLDFNWLAKRWNNADSQGNLYLLSGLGVADGSGDQRLGGFGGMEGDWESRRYYVSYENRYTAAGRKVRQEFQEMGRIGIAPYIAESGSLHSWLMLQVDHFPEDRKPWTLTPMVRMFKGEYLVEAGVASNGHPMLNLMITF